MATSNLPTIDEKISKEREYCRSMPDRSWALRQFDKWLSELDVKLTKTEILYCLKNFVWGFNFVSVYHAGDVHTAADRKAHKKLLDRGILDVYLEDIYDKNRTSYWIEACQKNNPFV